MRAANIWVGTGALACPGSAARLHLAEPRKNKSPAIEIAGPGKTVYLDAALAQNLSNAEVRSAAMSSASRVSMSLRCIM